MSTDWRRGLPTLSGQRVTLRELVPRDATSLSVELGTPDVKRDAWSLPPDAPAFTQFIEWAHMERATGQYLCYGIVPDGDVHAAGVFELRSSQPSFLRADLGFVLGSRLWARGLFPEGLGLLLDFAFQVVKAHRIEVRTPVDNARGNVLLHKLGAVREGRLRDAFWREDRYVDQYLWSLLESDCRPGRR
jgi:RimJ/RimL family protein N-acetyltransferase